MSARLHLQYAATVDRRMPWGLVVVLDDGTEVVVDMTKVGDVEPPAGSRVALVILDDQRAPARGSLLAQDHDIARMLRGRPVHRG